MVSFTVQKMWSWTTTVCLSIFRHQMEAIILCTVYAVVKNSGKNEIPLCLNHTFYQGLYIHLRTLVHCVHVSNFSHAFAAVSRCVRCVISAQYWPRRSNMRTQNYFQEKWKKKYLFWRLQYFFCFVLMCDSQSISCKHLW